MTTERQTDIVTGTPVKASLWDGLIIRYNMLYVAAADTWQRRGNTDKIDQRILHS